MAEIEKGATEFTYEGHEVSVDVFERNGTWHWSFEVDGRPGGESGDLRGESTRDMALSTAHQHVKARIAARG